jgi:hypothetical protein
MAKAAKKTTAKRYYEKLPVDGTFANVFKVVKKHKEDTHKKED